MKSPQRIQIVVVLLGLGGAGVFIALLLRHGISDIAHAVAAAGFGVAAIVAFHQLPLLMDAVAWEALFPASARLRLRSLVWMRWIGESVSTLLPAAQVGGDIVRARLAATVGEAPLPLAAATVLVDITLSVFMQLIFTLSGLTLLGVLTGRMGLIRPALGGSLILMLGVAGFYAVQRRGMFRSIASLAARLVRSSDWDMIVEHAQTLDREIRSIYACRRALLASSACTLSSLAIGACEVWIAFHALHVSGGYAKAYVLESVGQGIRAAMFLIPGALGVQEGGYMVVGGLLGIPAETALALALIRRVRELACGVPGLVAWEWVEGRLLWQRERIAGKVD